MDMSEHLNPRLRATKPSAIRAFSRLAADTPGCIRLTLGEPDFDTPAPVVAAAEAALEAGETHYIENAGSAALRGRIAAFERARGLDYAPEEIVVTVGATEALFAALFGVIGPGDEVIVPSPAFVLYELIISLCGGVCVFLDTEPAGFQIDGAALQALITPRTRAIVLNSPNNPTGCVLSEASLDAVEAAVGEKPVFVICDDVYRALCYTDGCRSLAERPSLRDRVIAVQSFSKPWAMTGWRMGYLMADRPVAEKLALLHQFTVTSTPAPFQRAAMAALDCDPGAMVSAYRRRRDYVTERLARMGLDTPRPDGAFYAFPSIARSGMDSTTFCERLVREGGVALTPGAAFGADGHVRLSYCCADGLLAEGLDRLERFVKKIGGGA